VIEMIPILPFTNWRNSQRSVRFAILTTLALGTVRLAFAQFNDHFANGREPVRDASVIPADFQQEVQNVAGNLESKEARSDTDLGSDKEFSIKDTWGGAEASSFVRGVKEQFDNLDLPRVVGSLAIVLGGYFSLVWLTRRFGGRGSGKLPHEVVEVLGQTPFRPGYNLQLIRLGNKLLLLMNGPEGFHTIGEISDPNEVARLCAACGVSSRIPRVASSGATTAVASPPPNSVPNTDLKQILRQLQRVADNSSNGAVFEA